MSNSDSEIHHIRGVELLKMGNYRKAISELRLAIRFNPAMWQSHNNLGCAFLKLGQNDAAIAAFENLLILTPGRVVAHVNYARSLLAARRYQEADRALQRASDIDANHPQISIGRGDLELARGNIALAITAFSEALIGEPSSIDARKGLAFSLAKSDQIDAAIPELRYVIELLPYDFDVRVTLARCLMVKAFTDMNITTADQAFREFDMATKLRPFNAKLRVEVASARSIRRRMR